MGWRFRRSFKAGPFRINISKSGVGSSVGGRGFRTGISANGRRYSRFTIPGTGISYTTEQGKGCLVVFVSTTLFAALAVSLHLAMR